MSQEEVKKIWLTISNVRLTGNQVQVQFQGEARDDKEGTWLPCEQTKPDPDKLFKIVQDALQNGRKVSGLFFLVITENRIKIEEIRVQYQ
ncbi:MAG: hypothetical protein GY856_06835 [bacterium]|nr:hypothetical protein [bacterium]